MFITFRTFVVLFSGWFSGLQETAKFLYSFPWGERRRHCIGLIPISPKLYTKAHEGHVFKNVWKRYNFFVLICWNKKKLEILTTITIKLKLSRILLKILIKQKIAKTK